MLFEYRGAALERVVVAVIRVKRSPQRELREIFHEFIINFNILLFHLDDALPDDLKNGIIVSTAGIVDDREEQPVVFVFGDERIGGLRKHLEASVQPDPVGELAYFDLLFKRCSDNPFYGLDYLSSFSLQSALAVRVSLAKAVSISLS